MRLLFVSNYFPPEVNAPATRLIEHARQWVKDGHEVEVLTSVPHFPEGKVYRGFRNGFKQEVIEGIDVTRVPMYVTENSGTLKRTLSYVSFMLSAILFSRRIHQRPDIIVATSPQFFCALGGYLISRLKRVPFVLEIRDLWPESIVAVGAMKRNAVIRLFEGIEKYLYEKSDHIVVVTNAFKAFIEQKGIDAGKISIIKNGADLSTYGRPLDPIQLESLREQLGFRGKFVASYLGTIGMAHRVDVIFEAAQRCNDADVVFLVAGTGAERKNLEVMQDRARLHNFVLLDKQPKDLVPYLLALSDVSVVHLAASPLFRTVIPSKVFEAMAMERPIVLGVEGETKEIVEEAHAGIPITPENADELLEAVLRLKNDRVLYSGMAASGKSYVHRWHNRSRLAREYWKLLEDVQEKTTKMGQIAAISA